MSSIETAPAVPLVIFGVPFHNVTFAEAIDWVVERVRAGRSVNVATANLDFITQAWNDPELQRILIEADLVIADGFPIVKLAPFFGPPLKERVTGSDITPMLAGRAAEEGVSIYGLGGEEGVAEKAMQILKERHPDLKVAGTYSPPYASLLEMDHDDILQRLEQARPDILFVAFGAPKQDKFINMHVHHWKVPVALGIGGTLDFIVGAQTRAPVWMQKIHLEWFWRMLSNPRRLFKRYMLNIAFLVSATRQILSIRRMPDKPVTFHSLEKDALAEIRNAGAEIETFSALGTEQAAHNFATELGTVAGRASIVMDIHAIPWLDSMELGALLSVNKCCRANGRRLILYAPRPKVRRLLETCRLIEYFDIAYSPEEVSLLLKAIASHVGGSAVYTEDALTLELPLELTAATLPEFRLRAEQLHHELKQQGMLKSIRIDAVRLDFIDSSGLGFLAGLKKQAQVEGTAVTIENMGPKPRRVLEIARVDKLLLEPESAA
ncbi:MAG: WecB/TagA/CpsF family glycosyltransferase [Kiritimatiellales bacterium]|nr:WecB/TagA/CpsF family glycosyltransferase [Kiritimatiellales bacterium]